MENNIRTRKYIISWNNYPKEMTLEKLRDIIIEYAEVDYLILGFEIGEIEHTPHIQGYVNFKNAQYFNSFRKLLDNKDGTYGYIAKARGNDIENQIYCSKQGNYIEYGKIKDESNDEVKNMINDIIEGMSFIELLKKYGKEIYYHYRDFKSLYNDIKDELKESETIEYYNRKTEELLKNE